MAKATPHSINSSTGYATWVVLLRAIGPETHKKMSMQQLRECCEVVGFRSVSTYIASGNLLFCSNENADDIEASIKAILAKFGLNNAVFLRQVGELEAVINSNPFPHSTVERPGKVLVSFMKRSPEPDHLSKLLKHGGPERIVSIGRELYIDYITAVGTSKVAPGIVERRLSAAGTTRNWNTVVKLAELAKQMSK
jgi:uncharacterized protein (DUF1697 family)